MTIEQEIFASCRVNVARCANKTYRIKNGLKSNPI